MAAVEKKGLARALASINKTAELKDAYVKTNSKNKNDVPFIHTGSFTLNRLLSGGWARGRIIEIYGPESSGKSTVAAHAIAEAQKAGGSGAYIDFEHAVHLGYINKGLGVNIDDPNKWAFFQPNTFEEGRDIANLLVNEGGVDVLVIDSVTAMTPKAYFEEETNDIGLQARLTSKWLGSFVKHISDSGTVVIFVNQVRQAIKLNQYEEGPNEVTSGGKAIRFYASVRVKLKPTKVETANISNPVTGKAEETPISNFVRAELVKNKVTGHKDKAEFCIRYGTGIDNIRTIMETAVNGKILKKDGSYYELPGVFRVQGKEAARRWLLTHDDDARTVYERTVSFLEKLAEDRFKTLAQMDVADEELASRDIALPDEVEAKLSDLDEDPDSPEAEPTELDDAAIEEAVNAKKAEAESTTKGKKRTGQVKAKEVSL